MLELDIRSFVRDRDRANALLSLCREQAGKGKFMAASQEFIKAVGITCLPRAESYHELMLSYMIGLMAAHIHDADLADEMISRSQTLPGHGGEPPFEDHQRESLVLAERQDQAIRTGMPSILLASMPRAASASFTQSLAEHFTIPVMRVSAGNFPNYFIMGSWLRRFLRGGAVLHDHFGASEHNIRHLTQAGARDLFVLIRDPRAAANSLTNMNGVADKDYEKSQWQLFGLYVKWLRGWVDFEDSSRIKVHWITSHDAMNNIGGVIQQIGEVYKIPKAVSAKARIVPANFVKGSDDAWRARCSEDLRQRMWAEIPMRMREVLNLTE